MQEPINVTCCVAGGGPAGMMAGYLLARAGVDVLVLEKHGDFLRDFRGDTIHPSTLEVMHELGLLEDFMALPHQEVSVLAAEVGDETFPVADFTHLPTRCRFIAFLPQWDFLNFLAKHGARFPNFALRMNSDVIGLVMDGNRIAGVRVTGENGVFEVRSQLLIAADGRHSIVREKAGLKVETLSAPMDVLWFALSRRPSDSAASIGRFDAGRIFIKLNRGEHWQCGFVIPKGTGDAVKRAGLPTFRANVAALAGDEPGRVEELRDWDQIKLLTVLVDRLTDWSRPGLLCIGDAAHAMSPVGGVGINLAIQDAVAAANVLAVPLRQGSLAIEDLRRVQRRRMWPTRVTQRLQIFMQNRIVTRVLGTPGAKLSPPLILRLLVRFPLLRRIPARLIGMGVRPEHVKIAESAPRR